MPLQEKSINRPSREKIGVDPRSMADLSSNPSLQPQPELFRFPGMAADAIGARLQSSMIWAGRETDGEPVAVTFRKTFPLEKAPNQAPLSIFADARYILWVNGRYVERGPGRFQPNVSWGSVPHFHISSSQRGRLSPHRVLASCGRIWFGGDGAFAPEAWVGSAIQPYPAFALICVIRGLAPKRQRTAVDTTLSLRVPVPP